MGLKRSRNTQESISASDNKFLGSHCFKVQCVLVQSESGIIRYVYDWYVVIMDKYEYAVTAETTAEEALPELDGTTCTVPTTLIGALISPPCHVSLPAPRKENATRILIKLQACDFPNFHICCLRSPNLHKNSRITILEPTICPPQRVPNESG